MKLQARLAKRNYDLQIVLLIGLLLAITLMVFNKDIGNILLTEIISVSVTVFIIDNMIERKERRKRISIDQRILREVQSIVASYFSIWKHLAWKYLPNEKIAHENDFLNRYSELIKRAKVNEEFEVVSLQFPESWDLLFHKRIIKKCFENYHDSILKQIKSLITEFNGYIEPGLFNLLLEVMECQYFRSIHLMGQAETEAILIELDQDTNRLDSYLNTEDKKHIYKIIELMQYSQNLRSLVSKFDEVNVDLYELKTHFTNPMH